MNNEKQFIKRLESVITGLQEGSLKLIGGTMESGVHLGSGQEYSFMVQPVDLEEQKRKQKEEALNKLINYINYDLHDIFRDAIKDNKEYQISSSTLRRGIGKTSTLVYLAIRYDLKLIVNYMFTARQLKEDFPTLEVYGREKAFNTEGLFSPGELVLMDEFSGSNTIRVTKF